MPRRVIHISESDGARDFRSLLNSVREGSEVVIEEGDRPVAILWPADLVAGRPLSGAIELASAGASGATLDADFALDLEAVIASHVEPFDPPVWD